MGDPWEARLVKLCHSVPQFIMCYDSTQVNRCSGASSVTRFPHYCQYLTSHTVTGSPCAHLSSPSCSLAPGLPDLIGAHRQPLSFLSIIHPPSKAATPHLLVHSSVQAGWWGNIEISWWQGQETMHAPLPPSGSHCKQTKGLRCSTPKVTKDAKVVQTSYQE